MTELLRIGEVAARAAVSTRTIDYYTGRGLIAPAARSEAGYRMYHPSTVAQVTTIRHLEAHHFSLDEIAQVMRGADADGTTDLSTLVAQLVDDIIALRSAVDTADPHTHAALTLLSARVHSLVTAALDIAATSPFL